MSGGHLWQEAAAFAARAHLNHVRKDRRTPYVSHPVRVALTVALVFGFPEETLVAAALLHDVLEDAPRDYDDLAERFGRDVADLVACVSKDARLPEPQREQEYDERLRAGPWQARLIKLADVYDNLQDLDTSDDGSRPRMLDRARRALELAAGDPQLRAACAAVRRLVQATESAPARNTRPSGVS